MVRVKIETPETRRSAVIHVGYPFCRLMFLARVEDGIGMFPKTGSHCHTGLSIFVLCKK